MDHLRKSIELNAASRGSFYMVQTIDMPSVLDDTRHNSTGSLPRSTSHSYSSNGIPSRLSSDLSRRDSGEKSTPALDGIPGGWPQTPGSLLNGGVRDGKDGNAPNGLNGAVTSDRPSSIKASSLSSRTRRTSGVENEKKAGEVVKDPISRPGAAEEGYFTLPPNGKAAPPRSPLSKPSTLPGEPMSAPYGRVVSGPQPTTTPGLTLPPLVESTPFQPSPSAVPDYSLLKLSLIHI